MKKEYYELIYGGLLHDIGKVVYRSGSDENHSESGYKFLKNEVNLPNKNILDQVRYHHAAMIRKANLPDDSLAYITYMADNISAAADRRKKSDSDYGFDQKMPLASIFNILNGNHDEQYYHPGTLNPEEGIHFPDKQKVKFESGFYDRIRQQLKDLLKNLDNSNGYVNSLLELLESQLTFVPSSTAKDQLADISLFDHSKLTAAIGCCIYAYLSEKRQTNYRKILFTDGREFDQEKAFLLCSIDISGIQKFIYHQYGTEDVLKNLRARSFYLEIMLENMIDELLGRIGLSRANLIYSGGGHAYLILPNTQEAKQQIARFGHDTNLWLQEYFKADLYAAWGYAECSAAELENKEKGSYQNIFHRASRAVSANKLHRYSSEDIRRLNHFDLDETRECKICHRSDHLTKEDLCEICDGLKRLSGRILSDRYIYYAVSEKKTENSIVIYKNQYLTAETEQDIRKRITQEKASHGTLLRCYCKNRMNIGYHYSTKLWVGDYHTKDTLEELIADEVGIHRMGVLRMDIDNLGQAFVAGFPDEYETLSRAATFSRKLSLFFKYHINSILENGEFNIDPRARKRDVSIVYSGGDDVFVLGAWKDVLEFAVDLYRNLKKFTEGTLTVSAGFGLYDAHYPISYIATETGNLEDAAKANPGKNSIALFEENEVYHWDEFIDDVIGKKLIILQRFFYSTEEHGKSLLYRMLDLLRNREKRINLARLAYLLARLDPGDKATGEQRNSFRVLAREMYRWMQDPEESKKAITAIYIYAYLIREETT